MKKILLCLLALAAGLTAFGQNESSFGVRAGLNVANLHFSAGGLSASMDSRASYHVGFAYQQPVLRVLPLRDVRIFRIVLSVFCYLCRSETPAWTDGVPAGPVCGAAFGLRCPCTAGAFRRNPVPAVCRERAVFGEKFQTRTI